MISNAEQIRAAIAEQAAEWFVANDAAPLDTQDSEALQAWLKSSPVHIEEFLAVSLIARDFNEARTDSEYSVEAILARARAVDDTVAQPLWPRATDAVRSRPSRRWLPVAVAMGTCAVLSVAWLLTWNVKPIEHPSALDAVTALHFETRHGEQLTRRLADNSVLHLNTDSAVIVRYSKAERLVLLRSGQASFEIAHEPARVFRVVAGSAEVIDLGTKFDVLVEHESTLVTVVEGRVAVGASNSHQNLSPRVVELRADQQIRVTMKDGPAAPEPIDAQRTTAWLRKQIVFDHDSLEHVATEYNRYASKPIEVATPALRNLQISGVFATDDPDAFVAFLRSLQGVRVEVTETRVRVR